MAFKSFPKPVKTAKTPNRTISKARAAKRRKLEAVKRDVYALVDARDRHVCRATGKYIGVTGGARHHIVYRSQGGKHETGNVVTLTTDEHERIHAHKLAVEGNADETLTFIDLTNGNTWESKCPT